MNQFEVNSIMEEIPRTILGYTFNFSSEKDLQEGLSTILDGWSREYRLSGSDRIDFFHERSGVGIEVKTGGGLTDVIRQLHRYSLHESVNGLILVSSLNRLTVLPEKLNDKPVRTVALVASSL